MCILILEADFPVARRKTRVERAETIANGGTVFAADQLLVCQHLSVRDRAAYVVRDKAGIQQVVFARGVAQNALVEWQTLFPEPAHDAVLCSAGVRPSMSSTTSVPVPSLVRTSRSMLSASLLEMI